MNDDVRQEQKKIDAVLQTLTEEINRLEGETFTRKKEIIQIRKHFWDEIKVNTDTFDDYLETMIGLRQEAMALSVTQSTHRHASNRLSTLKRMKDAPYFGRIDFIEDGASTPEAIYIGISTLSDANHEDFLIYDWRAPISSIYYDHQPGRAHYGTPEGNIHGVLKKKWQYLIANGQLQSMFDTSLTIGDEILKQVLGQGNNPYMQSIVATIQQEQNEIIRHDSKKLLLVHGAAGSGKTSAALQRIAYLLYKYRDTLSANQIVLFSPNSIFNDYVSNVLPELGEENMQQVTFQDYLHHRLRHDVSIEDPYEQLEYCLTASNSSSLQTRIASIQFKASPHFFHAIHRYIDSLLQSGMIFKDISFRGESIVTAQQIADTFYRSDGTTFSNRLEDVTNWLTRLVKKAEIAQRHLPWAAEEIELLSNETYHKAHAYLAKKQGFHREAISDYEMDPEALTQLIVQQKFKPLRQHILRFQFIDFKALYAQFFNDSSEGKQWLTEDVPKWGEICQATLNMLHQGKLLYEDTTPFLLLKEMIQGFEANRSIKHIIIDEAQDYSPFQFEYIKRLFPKAKMTVLGDFNQAIFAHASEADDFHMLRSIYGPDETFRIHLTRSYRSTKEIIEFTSQLIPHGKKIIPFNRHGQRPHFEQVKDTAELHTRITASVRKLQQQGYTSIAIICQSAKESAEAYDALTTLTGRKLLQTHSTHYEQGIVIIPAYLAKGIEFDAVIIYNASYSNYAHEQVRRLFYTACTRAMHVLQLYSVGEPSPFLQSAQRSGFLQ
ncbi:ATP-dependent DNA helicase replicase [Fictibacillus macauensis ZFHKF-1]|uniref:ATP-dependent DNA helicase replicase n=1 Tax=Fictibacillus macauensis ZFHKF-1 TaxID=1196324 RepID=I8AID3_9BACL|nr:RNA polymerase recycling motor HelD [Fictibacillus macauensis]EIT85462.1 ATP-dependent DNA helicase replicase [Fictibacillus macauensis ZFHKF-1]